ncbi:trehalose-6-phosphate synthase [uncultured Amnibacterium sp.]|uniref:alpha,alpha-trehalose-phosphate synthase (UDP-forming) n=1 Tax=uncultured Amnibacterium sp. TaxID=1631851 RepID=UPI0035CA9BDF
MKRSTPIDTEHPIEHETSPSDGAGDDSGGEHYSFVVISNRLPVDRATKPDGTQDWKPSPGGLVTALEPVMRSNDGAWIGWTGLADDPTAPFDADGLRLIPVELHADEVEQYYEGFSNDTLWPLYHDVIAQPSYHRPWWDSYKEVNRRFAAVAADIAAPGATVWVQDYQLQLVPKLLREARPDLTIGFFNHIPFPAYGIYSQLPWRAQIVEGLLGADLIGFQRRADAGNFARAVRRLFHLQTKDGRIALPAAGSGVWPNSGSERGRTVRARHFPISIDSASYVALAKRADVQARAAQIRRDLGNPSTIMLGVDRLDYTKGIGHRIAAYAELLAEQKLDVDDTVLVQIASPSRERVESYRSLRDEIELTVGRVNGDFGTIKHSAINYLHHGYPREEMVALFLAADIMLVTALRDGMNLVAKEYVAARHDDDGVLVLSEFAGAADELRQALLVNPHDIEGLKRAILNAVHMPRSERRQRMRALRRRVLEHDVERWSTEFLSALRRAREERHLTVTSVPEDQGLEDQGLTDQMSGSEG